jgi:hypothetical protein
MLWGGCVSCPQFFMFPKAEKNCCDKAGQCERPSKSAPVKECTRMALEPHGFVSVDPDRSAVPVATASLIPNFIAGSAVLMESPQVEPSPPDLTVLNSTFLI